MPCLAAASLKFLNIVTVIKTCVLSCQGPGAGAHSYLASVLRVSLVTPARVAARGTPGGAAGARAGGRPALVTAGEPLASVLQQGVEGGRGAAGSRASGTSRPRLAAAVGRVALGGRGPVAGVVAWARVPSRPGPRVARPSVTLVGAGVGPVGRLGGGPRARAGVPGHLGLLHTRGCIKGMVHAVAGQLCLSSLCLFVRRNLATGTRDCRLLLNSRHFPTSTWRPALGRAASIAKSRYHGDLGRTINTDTSYHSAEAASQVLGPHPAGGRGVHWKSVKCLASFTPLPPSRSSKATVPRSAQSAVCCAHA